MTTRFGEIPTDKLHNFEATVTPSVTDDSAAGYDVGSRWVDVSADKPYICVDATAGAAVWVEMSGEGHDELHGVSTHTGKIGERQVQILIPLTKPLPAATNNATLDDDYLYKKPYNVAQRINKWYVRFESNLAAEAIFQLYKNGSQITGAQITVAASARDAAIDDFTEVTLADDDSLEVFQTGGNAEDIGGKAYVYGDEDVMAAIS